MDSVDTTVIALTPAIRHVMTHQRRNAVAGLHAEGGGKEGDGGRDISQPLLVREESHCLQLAQLW